MSGIQGHLHLAYSWPALPLTRAPSALPSTQWEGAPHQRGQRDWPPLFVNATEVCSAL